MAKRYANEEIAHFEKHPQSAVVNVSTRFGHKGTPMDYVNYIDSVIDCKRGYKGRHEEAGRPAGTRVEWDEQLQIFRVM